VLDPRLQPRLEQQPALALRPRPEHELDRHGTLERAVPTPMHLAHSTAAKETLELHPPIERNERQFHRNQSPPARRTDPDSGHPTCGPNCPQARSATQPRDPANGLSLAQTVSPERTCRAQVSFRILGSQEDEMHPSRIKSLAIAAALLASACGGSKTQAP